MSSPSYLDPATLASVGSIEIRARMIVEGLMTGMHRSPYQGFSVEFAQHRPYAVGDDLRFLDWKVFARTDKLHLKQYQKETNLDLLLMVDVSGSMGYDSGSVKPDKKSKKTAAGVNPRAGTPKDDFRGWRKYDHAATMAAALAYLALQQQDRVGLMLFGNQVHGGTRMSNAQGHWRTIAETLEKQQIEPAGGDVVGPEVSDEDAERRSATNLSKLFDTVTAKLTQRSLLVLISDLFDRPEALERGLARLHHRRHDVILLHTLDHAERTFPFRSPSAFYGLEGEGRLGIDPGALKQAYLEALEEHSRRVEEAARKFRFDYLPVDTSEPVGPVLSHFLAQRAAQVNRARLR